MFLFCEFRNASEVEMMPSYEADVLCRLMPSLKQNVISGLVMGKANFLLVCFLNECQLSGLFSLPLMEQSLCPLMLQ